MRELGLLSFWKRQYTIRADLQVSRCSNIIHSKETEPEKQLDRKPLTLGSLYGAFILLFVGYIIALLAFVFELITFHRGSLKRKVAPQVNSGVMKQNTVKRDQVIDSSSNNPVIRVVSRDYQLVIKDFDESESE